MTVLVIVEARLRNPAKMAEYSAAAAPIVAAFGGEFIHRAKYVETLGGSATPDGLGVLRFPSVDAARTWFNSPDYQAIVPLREEGAEMSFHLYEEA